MIRQAVKQKVGQLTELTREQYNETLFVFENWGMGQQRDTPLSAKLFTVIAMQNHDKNRITLEQLVEQCANQLSNYSDSQTYSIFYLKKKTIKIVSFLIYDRNHDKSITQEEFLTFIQESWVAAFRQLSKLMAYDTNTSASPNQNTQNSTVKAVENFATINMDKLSQEVMKDFSRYDLDKNGVRFYCIKTSIGISMILRNGVQNLHIILLWLLMRIIRSKFLCI